MRRHGSARRTRSLSPAVVRVVGEHRRAAGIPREHGHDISRGPHEKTHFPDAGRCRACGHRHRRAGDRAGRAAGQMAPRLELSQESRYDLRRGSILLRARRQADRRQVRDHPVRGRTDRAAAAGPRRGAARHGRMRAYRLVLLRQQEQGVRLRLRDSVRSHFASAIGVGICRRRHGAAAGLLQGIRDHPLPRGQHRDADGRLVQEGDQDGRGPEGPEDAHPRDRRRGHGAPGRGAAGVAGRRNLRGAGARSHRCGRVDRPVRRREARPLQDRQALLLSGVLGGRHRDLRHDQRRGMGQAAQASIRRRSSPLPPRPMSRCRRSTTPRIRSL